MKRTKKVLAELLLICMMISSVFPAYAETTEILTGTEVVEEAPANGSQEEPEVKEETPAALSEVEEVPAEPVEIAGADGDFVCAEIMEAAEAVEAEETDEVSGDAAESIGTEKTAKEKLLGTSQHNEHAEITDWMEWTSGSSLPVATGSYYLKQDVTLESTWSVPSDGTTNLCLNGYVIKANTSEGNDFNVITVPEGATLNLYDCDTTTVHKGYVDANGLWHIGDTVPEGCTEENITGGIITGGSGGGVYIQLGTFTMNGGNIAGNSAASGGGVRNSGNFTMSGGIITGNTAKTGGGVYAAFNNDLNKSVILAGGTVTGNRAEEDGGGVYVQEEQCFAAGTLITMEDGSRKPIETLEIGDPVRVFDHDTGAISTAKLFDLWKYPEKHSGAVTLHFSHGIDVTVVYGHSFFDREAKKYVSVSRDNVDSYVGHEFYNVDDACWETLDDYDLLDGEVDTYVITSEKHLNCVANGMLSNEDGLYTTLTNVFEYGDGLKIDAEKKADDLEKYGLFGYEELQYVSKETYDILNLQYLNVAFGKGMITKDAFLALEAYWAEVDPELLCGTTAQPCIDEAGETYFETSSGSVQNDKPKMLSAAGTPEPKSITPGVYLGGTIKIIDNTAKAVEGTTANNLYLPGSKTITLGTGTGDGGNGVAAPEEDMNVGVTMENVTGPFTTNGTAEEVKYFTSDDKTLAVTHVAKESDHLELVKSWEELQNALNGTTTDTIPGLFEINDGTIKLLRNFTAEEGDERFVVPAGTDIVLDLNGFTVDRGLTDEESAVIKGNIFTVNGKLTIEDNSDGHTGKITGGTSAYGAAVISNGETVLKSGSIAGCKAINETYDKENSVYGRGGAIYVSGNGKFTMNGGEISNCSASVAGGAIFNAGTVNITGGSISGCSASGVDDKGTVKAKGGAVYNYGYSSFTMEGGEISGNTLGNVKDMRGAGVYAAAGADITLGGKAVITGNTDGGSENSNVFLYDGVTITLGTGTGEGGNGVAVPTEEMSIGVTTQKAPVSSQRVDITGKNAADYHSCFSSDNTNYAVVNSGSGKNQVVQLREHEHSWKYESKDNQITATCTDTVGGTCGYKTTPLTLTLTAPGSAALVYDGTAKSVDYADGEADAWRNVIGSSAPAIKYYEVKDTTEIPLESAPIKAGNYVAKAAVGSGESAKTAELQFAISKKQLTVTGTAVEETRVYDGTKVAKVTAEGSLTNAVEGDDITLGATAAFADANAGKNKAVTVTYTITGDDAGNYIAPVNNTSLTASITKANVPAPLLKDSVTINCAAETIAPKEGFELSLGSGEAFDAGKITAKTAIDFTKSYYIRKAEDENHFASAELTYTPVHPAAPSGFTAKEESIENKKDGTFSGITSAMEYQKNGGEWVSGPATLSGLSDETITVRTKATDEAFKSLNYTYTFTASTGKLTVTMGEVIEKVPYDGLVTKPADPVREGFAFGGWYTEEACITAWNFAVDTVKDNMTLYPKWVKNEEKKAVIGGNVTEDGVKVPRATVELFLGTEKIAAAVTDNDGNYKFDNVKLGTYNIVVTKAGGSKTKTELVTVDRTGEFSADVKLPKGDVSSKVEHKEGDTIPEAKSDISKTVVGGLDEIAEEQTPAGSDRITIKLTVEPKKDEETPAQQKIKKEAGEGKKVEFLDLSLLKQVNGGDEEDIGDKNNKLLTIVIPFNFEGVNVTGMMILRNHGGNTSKLTETPNSDGEYFTPNRSEGTLTIRAKRFSDYAIAYSEVTTPDPSDDESDERHIAAYAEPVANATAVNGSWQYKEAEDTWYYIVDGSSLKNGWYYLANPYSKTVKTGWFCFDEAGKMQRGWILSKLGHWFFTHDIKDGDLGRLEKGWHKDDQDGLSYYLDLQTGRMYTGWHVIDGVTYYFTETSVKTTWKQDEKGRWVATAAIGKPLGSLDPTAKK